MMDCRKQARDLCEVLGIPFEDAGTSAEQWILQFAAKVLRDEVTGFRQAYSTEFFSEVTIADYGKMPAETFVSCWSASMGRHIVECIERRAKEIEGGE